jgi:hypothetical protein
MSQREVTSYCRFCVASCGIKVTVDGDSVIRVRGDMDHPTSHGYTCPKGRSLPRWHEDPRRLDEPALGVVPAHECLDAGRGARAERDLRLVVEHELVAVERAMQVVLERQPLHGAPAQLVAEHLAAAAAALGGVHRRVRLTQQPLGAPARAGVRDTDRGADVVGTTGDLERTTADEILGLIDSLNDEIGNTIIMVTHDPTAAEKAHRIVHLEKGVLVD